MDWISIKDKLPDENKHVIGFYINSWTGDNMIYNCQYKGGRFYDDLVDVTNTFTHWMPLPEPPK